MRHDQNWKFDEKNLIRERENKDGEIKKQSYKNVFHEILYTDLNSKLLYTQLKEENNISYVN